MKKAKLLGLTEEFAQKHEVRLFSTSNIRGEAEAEVRATAAFLSVVQAVSEFAGKVCSGAGGPGGKLKNARCYTETSFIPIFKDDKKKNSRPDGIIYVQQGQKKEWAAFLEVKVGKNTIKPEQVRQYIDWAIELKIDAVITISHEALNFNGDLPYEIPAKLRKNARVKVVHYSWERLSAMASRMSQNGNEGVQDDDQRWILNEWLRYVTSEAAGIMSPPELGEQWFSLVEANSPGTMKTQSESLKTVFTKWQAFLRIVALRLEARLNTNVFTGQRRSPAEYKKWCDQQLKEVQTTGAFVGRMSFRGTAINPIGLTLRINQRKIEFSYETDTEKDGRQETRIKNILRPLFQNQQIPKDLYVLVYWKRKGLGIQVRYERLNGTIEKLLMNEDGTRVDKKLNPERVEIRWIRPLKSGKGKNTSDILSGIYENLLDFYRIVSLLPTIPMPVKKLSVEVKESEEPSAIPYG